MADGSRPPSRDPIDSLIDSKAEIKGDTKVARQRPREPHS
jgi:hypothetical protein